jgi:parallel beta-helix repeat protein
MASSLSRRALMGAFGTAGASTLTGACTAAPPDRPPLEIQSRGVDVRSYGAAGNGEADDTAAIAAAFDAAGPGGHVFFPSGGVFAVVSLPDPLPGMVLSGGATIRRSSGAESLLRVRDTDDVVIDGLTFDGNHGEGDLVYVGGSSRNTTIRRVVAKNATESRSTGIRVDGATDSRISDVDVENCYCGIMLGGSCRNVDLSSFAIRNCLSSGVSEGSLYLASVTGAQISHGYIAGNRNSGVYAPGKSSDLTLFSVTAVQNGADEGDELHYRGFVFTETCSNVRLIGCHAESNRECGFYSWTETSNFTVVGCTAYHNNIGMHAGGHGFELNGHEVSVVGCQASGTNGDAAGEGSGFATGGVGVAYSGCISWDNSWCGFRSASGRNISYSSCTAKNNSRVGPGMADGFKIDVGGSDIVIAGCCAFDDQAVKTQGYGVRISGSVDNYVISGNMLRNNLSGALVDDGGQAKVVSSNLT